MRTAGAHSEATTHKGPISYIEKRSNTRATTKDQYPSCLQ
jgi:hypothetical protein